MRQVANMAGKENTHFRASTGQAEVVVFSREGATAGDVGFEVVGISTVVGQSIGKTVCSSLIMVEASTMQVHVGCHFSHS